MKTRILIRGDSEENWEAKNPTLAFKELAYSVCRDGMLRFKVGDGLVSWMERPYMVMPHWRGCGLHRQGHGGGRGYCSNQKATR